MGTKSSFEKIFTASIKGQSQKVQHLLEDDPDNLISVNHMLAFKEAAEAGHLDTVNVFLNHNKEYAQSHLALQAALLHHHLPVFDRLVDISCTIAHNQALPAAAAEGFVTVVDKLLTYVDDQQTLEAALSHAASNNHLPIVKTLLPSVPFEKRFEALVQAVLHNNKEIVVYLIPLCDPKGNNSRALQFAVEEKLFDIADMLYPLSNPQEALECILEDWDLKPGDPLTQYLEDRIESDRLKDVLSREVSSPRAIAKKM